MRACRTCSTASLVRPEAPMTTLVPPTTSRSLLALHLCCGLPLVALAVWFGAVDRPPLGGGRCASCGVEGSVIGAYVAAAGWLAAMVAWAAAARRELREGVRAPGRVTIAALAAAAALLISSLLWHGIFALPAFAAMVISVAALPVAAVRWLVVGVAWWRLAPADAAELRGRAGAALAGAWVCLA